MSNADFPGELNRDELNPGDARPLRDALRALPALAPATSAWPQLAARLAEQRDGANVVAIGDRAVPARRRWFVPLALAAALVLAAVALQLRRPAPQSAQPVAAATVAPDRASSNANAANSTKGTNVQESARGQLAALQQRSQALERWLHETARSATPLPGQDLAAAAEIEDMIGLVDVQLNAAPRDAELPLWGRRVALLEDLTALRYSSYSVAESGTAARLMPANWTN